MDGLELLYNYFTVILPFCNQQKVKNLLIELGYTVEDEPTEEMCMTAIKECDTDFTIPFGKIAQEAMDSTAYSAFVKLVNNNDITL